MAVAGGNPVSGHSTTGLGEQPPGVDEGIRARTAVEMAALDQDGGAGGRGQALALLQRGGPVPGLRFVHQDGQLGEVGRDQVRERQQGEQGSLRRFLQQPVPARGHHHRIQDHDGGTHLLQPAADRVNHLRACPISSTQPCPCRGDQSRFGPGDVGLHLRRSASVRRDSVGFLAPANSRMSSIAPRPIPALPRRSRSPAARTAETDTARPSQYELAGDHRQRVAFGTNLSAFDGHVAGSGAAQPRRDTSCRAAVIWSARKIHGAHVRHAVAQHLRLAILVDDTAALHPAAMARARGPLPGTGDAGSRRRPCARPCRAARRCRR